MRIRGIFFFFPRVTRRRRSRERGEAVQLGRGIMIDEEDVAAVEITPQHLETIPTWQHTPPPLNPPPTTQTRKASIFPFNPSLNSVIRLWKGDVWTMQLDAIVSSTNETLTETQGVNGAIMHHAGPELMLEIEKLEGCRTGEAKIVPGFSLPARYLETSIFLNTHPILRFFNYHILYHLPYLCSSKFTCFFLQKYHLCSGSTIQPQVPNCCRECPT